MTGFGADLAAIQVTGEANLTGIPDAGDGGYPGAVEALVHGLSAAADAKREHGLDVLAAVLVAATDGLKDLSDILDPPSRARRGFEQRIQQLTEIVEALSISRDPPDVKV